jgi:hypothetical protein
MADGPKGPVFSPVNYAAWASGYAPPGEHVLIDALQFRGAKVEMACSVGKDERAWVVYQGKAFSRKARQHLMDMMRELDSILAEDNEGETPLPPPPASQGEGE